MDSAGDAEGNFTVIGLVEDPSAPGGWSARPVATFRYANSSDKLPVRENCTTIVCPTTCARCAPDDLRLLVRGPPPHWYCTDV
ncbi:hypothetical protein MSG28_003870 [Choristoneura fumiferana]|uniref:Uncharacterized protein n=1 Tax=Choristoneura fumiferana TaxID=7141 RepID=A0ACC0KGW2_CHOFU|nr:hypothetical protein MSG28_003870 [Choristoneura fumiferana]